MSPLTRKLLEFTSSASIGMGVSAPLKPGQSVNTIQRGAVKRFQVVQAKGNRALVVDPENPTKVEPLDVDNLVPEDEDEKGKQLYPRR